MNAAGRGGYAQKHKLLTGSPLIGERHLLPRTATMAFLSATRREGSLPAGTQFKELREGSSGARCRGLI
jgi:hypothetical protein